MKQHECTGVFARLSEFLDQELPKSTCEEFARHIADCAPCVQFVESLKKSIRVTHDYELEELPMPLSAEARAQLRRAFDRCANPK